MRAEWESQMPISSAPVYISVDTEAAGPNPSEYALLSIGACLVSDPAQAFYVELVPTSIKASPTAMAVSGLSLADLAESGTPPEEGMLGFEAWVRGLTAEGDEPVFVAFNAPFDWMFVNDYFHRYAGRNPFGHSALDMKVFYMGLYRVPWRQTSMQDVAAQLGVQIQLPHHALQDARLQALLFRRLLAEWEKEHRPA
jgi:DNA polymerase III epsilon subunit-like protein